MGLCTAGGTEGPAAHIQTPRECVWGGPALLGGPRWRLQVHTLGRWVLSAREVAQAVEGSPPGPASAEKPRGDEDPDWAGRGAWPLQGWAAAGTWLQLDLQLADRAVFSEKLHLPVQGVQAEGCLQTGECRTWTGGREAAALAAPCPGCSLPWAPPSYARGNTYTHTQSGDRSLGPALCTVPAPTGPRCHGGTMRPAKRGAP